MANNVYISESQILQSLNDLTQKAEAVDINSEEFLSMAIEAFHLLNLSDSSQCE